MNIIGKKSKKFFYFEKNGKYVIVPTAFYPHTKFEIDSSFFGKVIAKKELFKIDDVKFCRRRFILLSSRFTMTMTCWPLVIQQWIWEKVISTLYSNPHSILRSINHVWRQRFFSVDLLLSREPFIFLMWTWITQL